MCGDVMGEEIGKINQIAKIILLDK